MRAALGFDLDERGVLCTWTDALRRFIEQVDSLGVLVMVDGIVGNNTRRKLDPALKTRVGPRFGRALVSSTLGGRTSFSGAFRLLGIRKVSTLRELAASLEVGS